MEEDSEDMGGENNNNNVVFPDAAEFPQRHDEVVLAQTWWWAVHLSLSTVALIANLLFIATIIYNRKRQQLQTFVSAIILTISILDVLDVLRVLPVLIESFFLQEIFRHVFCSFGVFHELSVAIFLVTLAVAVCWQSGQDTKYYTRSDGVKPNTIAHKVTVPLVLLLSAAAAAPFFLLPYDKLSHTCTDPMRMMSLGEGVEDNPKFSSDLYASLVTVFTYILPVLVIPLALPIAAAKTCLGKQCCVPRFKQSIGELVMVGFVSFIYLGTVVGVVLPRVDKMLELGVVNLGPAPLLWELGNDAVRPLVYFLTNPAVWEGLQSMCCRGKRMPVSQEDEDEDVEVEVPLSPVTTV